jgi:hypothetical protein
LNNVQQVTQETIDLMKTSMGNLEKAVTISTGLVGYNLEAPAKSLIPFNTPLRNRIARVKSKGGDSVHWKAITAINAAGKSTAAEGTRGNAISYVTEDKQAIYRVLGLQDSVTMEAQAAGKNFQDAQATATTNCLLKVMSEEEILLLGGNRTALGAMVAPTVSKADTGGTIAAATYVVKVVGLTITGANRIALNMQMANLSLPVFDGCTAASAAGTVEATAVGTSTLTMSTTPKKGAFAYAWFVGEAGEEVLQIVTTNSAVTLTELVAGGTAVAGFDADRSGDALAFDGLVPQLLAGGCYFKDMANAQFNPVDNGVKEIDEMNAYLWNMYRISPTMYLVNEQVQSDITKAIVSSNGGPQIMITSAADQGSILGGYICTKYLNKATGQVIPIMSHPNLPNGTLVAKCEQIPYPSSEISNVLEVETSYDYTQIEYARTSPKYEFEVRTFEVLKDYFPVGGAVITNLKRGLVAAS